MQLDRATARNFGQEYCGIIYSRGDGIYRVSHPSPLGEPQLRGEATQKSCFPVRRVVDPEADRNHQAEQQGGRSRNARQRAGLSRR
jgi:hypothetical protein